MLIRHVDAIPIKPSATSVQSMPQGVFELVPIPIVPIPVALLRIMAGIIRPWLSALKWPRLSLCIIEFEIQYAFHTVNNWSVDAFDAADAFDAFDAADAFDAFLMVDGTDADADADIDADIDIDRDIICQYTWIHVGILNFKRKNAKVFNFEICTCAHYNTYWILFGNQFVTAAPRLFSEF